MRTNKKPEKCLKLRIITSHRIRNLQISKSLFIFSEASPKGFKTLKAVINKIIQCSGEIHTHLQKHIVEIINTYMITEESLKDDGDIKHSDQLTLGFSSVDPTCVYSCGTLTAANIFFRS